MNIAPHRRLGVLELVRELLADEKAVSILKSLRPPALAQLVENVGLRDSGPILSLASTKQIEGVFDLDLWKNELPGEVERFDSARFGTWLEVLVEANPEQTVERFLELDPDFLTYALAERVHVLNLDAMTLAFTDDGSDRQLAEDVEKIVSSRLHRTFGEFLVIAKDPEGWGALVEVLSSLEMFHQEFLGKLLNRLEYVDNDRVEETGALEEVLTAGQQIASDVAFDREQRREREGHVPPRTARQFLETAAQSPLATEVHATAVDPITNVHFRNFSPAEAPELRAATTPEGERWTRRLLQITGESALAESTPELLGTGKDAGKDWVTDGLRRLAGAQPKIFDQRLQELAYLANVLIAGYSPGGAVRLRSTEAAELALETVVAGADEVRRQLRLSEDEVVERESLVKLFRVGWRLLHPAQKHN